VVQHGLNTIVHTTGENISIDLNDLKSHNYFKSSHIIDLTKFTRPTDTFDLSPGQVAMI